jgi:hypothetical protein
MIIDRREMRDKLADLLGILSSVPRAA